MDIEHQPIVDDFPIKNGNFQVFHVWLPEGS